MSTITRTHLVDDLDGSEDDIENVQFALDGTNYEIDLSAANADRLRDKLAKFVAAASPVKSKTAAASRTSRAKATSSSSSREQVQAIRDWARSAGHQVSARGRISKEIQAAFDAAH